MNSEKTMAAWKRPHPHVPCITKIISAADTWQKNGFLQWSHTRYINYTSVWAPCSGVVSQHEMNSLVFLEVDGDSRDGVISTSYDVECEHPTAEEGTGVGPDLL